jgi:hypothetical protein
MHGFQHLVESRHACAVLNSWLREVDPLVVELRDGLLMDHTVTL